MKRNTIKVVCNPYTNKMSYYFKNELGEWDVLSGNSPLSRKFYTDTTVQNRAKEILSKIDEIYNRKNKGVDILFEGTDESYQYMLNTIKDVLSERNIECKLGSTKIAVLGKKSVGKTSLIEGLEKLQGCKYKKTAHSGYFKYADGWNHAEWYEVLGIDLGKDEVERAYETVKKLSEDNLSAVIYCISATSGKIEDIEKQLIKKIADCFSEIRVMIALTYCYKDEIQETMDEIGKITDQIKIVPTLAKEYKTRAKNEAGEEISIEPFGLEEVSLYVFEGR